MLASLSIRDIVLIRSLQIEFGSGLSVLSGETGAGKSILLDSLSLALGARGDGDLVRVGQQQGQVSAVFDLAPTHPATAMLRELGLVDDNSMGEALILRRLQNADGRTRAFVNDQPVSVNQLKQIGRMLVEIHGQHEERAMVDPMAHRDLVDAYGGHTRELVEYQTIWRSWREETRELEKLRARIATAEKEADYLRSSVEELAALAPTEGEEEELAGRRQKMMSAEKIADDINEAHEVLSGSASPITVLSSTVRKLERKMEVAPGLLENAINAFDAAIDALSTAESELHHAIRLSEFDPNELESAEERLFALRAASRKYHVPVEELSALAEKLAEDLDALDAGSHALAGMEKSVAEKRGQLESCAAKLTAARRKATQDLADRVMEELPELKLEQARFFVEMSTDLNTLAEEGADTLEFFVQTNPGTRPGAMMKVASGGELSRFLLALKVALADSGSAPTLVFDEIDTGVGGAVADAIGRRLARLSEHVQVLSVTHAPQVAARANVHYLISKTGSEALETSVNSMTSIERTEEIARMLSGAKITNEARAAAEQLLSVQ